jgi:hypothetical protein
MSTISVPLVSYYEREIPCFSTLNKMSYDTRIHVTLQPFHSWNEKFDPYKKYYYFVGCYNK